MPWAALVYNAEISVRDPFYVKVDRALTRNITRAHFFTTREEALDAATEASFEWELIGAEYVEESAVGDILGFHP